MIQGAISVEQVQNEGADGVAGEEARFGVYYGLASVSLRLVDAPALEVWGWGRCQLVSQLMREEKKEAATAAHDEAGTNLDEKEGPLQEVLLAQ